MEVWKSTHIRADYEVSNLGNVRRIKRSPKRYGVYSYLKLYSRRYTCVRIGKAVNVHRLVAIAFIPNPNNYPVVMHLDNNPHNNSADNLQWGTISINTQQAYDDGLIKNHYSPFKKTKNI